MTSQNRRPTMKDNQAKYPQLRFKGFTDPWEQRKLGEIFLERKSRSSDGELISVTIKTGVVKANDLNRRDNSSFDKSNYKTVQKGDIAYNSMRMWQGASGYSPFNGILSPAYTVLKPKSYDVNSEFFAYMFKKKPMLQCFQRSSQGLTSDTWNLKYPALSSIQVKVPSVEEQIKIAGLFKKVDHLIALHQRKLAMLKELKQGYLQKLFPQNGSNFPQLRFAGFADAWEQRKLGDLGDILRKSIDPQLTPSREFVEYSMPSYDRGKRPNRVLGESMQSTRLKISGTVLLINKLNVRQRRIWFVKKAPENAVASGEFVPFQSFEIDLGFLHQLFLSDKTTSELQSISSGTSNSQKRVTPSDLLHYPICIPTTKGEQVVVGRFLSSIDNLITLHQRKLEKLQELKKGYLQKMFC